MKMEIKVFALENERQFIGMYRKTREEEVIFLKKLLRGEVVSCSKCEEADLEHLHKKAKKSNTRWKCPGCGEIYKTVNMLYELPDE